MKLGCIKNLYSGIKQGIKNCRSARSPQTLALKRAEAKNYVEAISDETWNNISKSVFEQKGESHSILLDKIQNYKKFCDKNGIEMPEDVLEAYTKLEHKATVFSERMLKAKAKGKTPKNTHKYGDRFEEINKEPLEKLNSFIDEQQVSARQKWRNLIYCENFDKEACDRAEYLVGKIEKNSPNLRGIENTELYNAKIGEIAPGIIRNNQTMYHGTAHPKSISRNGFHLRPKNGQAAFGARELGEGVYLTPDKKVASLYAGFTGGIIPLKVDTKKVAVVNNRQLEKLTYALIDNLDNQQMQNSATIELAIKKLFKKNGFNAAYSKEALGSGLFEQSKLLDALVGGKQSQLTVFDPKDITILDKTLKDRITNQQLQVNTLVKMPINLYKYIKNSIKKYSYT